MKRHPFLDILENSFLLFLFLGLKISLQRLAFIEQHDDSIIKLGRCVMNDIVAKRHQKILKARGYSSRPVHRVYGYRATTIIIQ